MTKSGYIILLTLSYRGHFICFLSSTWLRNLTKRFGQELLGFGQPNLSGYKWIANLVLLCRLEITRWPKTRVDYNRVVT